MRSGLFLLAILVFIGVPAHADEQLRRALSQTVPAVLAATDAALAQAVNDAPVAVTRQLASGVQSITRAHGTWSLIADGSCGTQTDQPIAPNVPRVLAMDLYSSDDVRAARAQFGSFAFEDIIAHARSRGNNQCPATSISNLRPIWNATEMWALPQQSLAEAIDTVRGVVLRECGIATTGRTVLVSTLIKRWSLQPNLANADFRQIAQELGANERIELADEISTALFQGTSRNPRHTRPSSVTPLQSMIRGLNSFRSQVRDVSRTNILAQVLSELRANDQETVSLVSAGSAPPLVVFRTQHTTAAGGTHSEYAVYSEAGRELPRADANFLITSITGTVSADEGVRNATREFLRARGELSSQRLQTLSANCPEGNCEVHTGPAMPNQRTDSGAPVVGSTIVTTNPQAARPQPQAARPSGGKGSGGSTTQGPSESPALQRRNISEETTQFQIGTDGRGGPQINFTSSSRPILNATTPNVLSAMERERFGDINQYQRTTPVDFNGGGSIVQAIPLSETSSLNVQSEFSTQSQRNFFGRGIQRDTRASGSIRYQSEREGAGEVIELRHEITDTDRRFSEDRTSSTSASLQITRGEWRGSLNATQESRVSSRTVPGQAEILQARPRPDETFFTDPSPTPGAASKGGPVAPGAAGTNSRSTDRNLRAELSGPVAGGTATVQYQNRDSRQDQYRTSEDRFGVTWEGGAVRLEATQTNLTTREGESEPTRRRQTELQGRVRENVGGFDLEGAVRYRMATDIGAAGVTQTTGGKGSAPPVAMAEEAQPGARTRTETRELEVSGSVGRSIGNGSVRVQGEYEQATRGPQQDQRYQVRVDGSQTVGQTQLTGSVQYQTGTSRGQYTQERTRIEAQLQGQRQIGPGMFTIQGDYLQQVDVNNGTRRTQEGRQIAAYYDVVDSSATDAQRVQRRTQRVQGDAATVGGSYTTRIAGRDVSAGGSVTYGSHQNQTYVMGTAGGVVNGEGLQVLFDYSRVIAGSSEAAINSGQRPGLSAQVRRTDPVNGMDLSLVAMTGSSAQEEQFLAPGGRIESRRNNTVQVQFRVPLCAGPNRCRR